MSGLTRGTIGRAYSVAGIADEHGPPPRRAAVTPDSLCWAPRLRKEEIRRLYELDARGIVDEDLIDEVGTALYARCDSIRIATDAHQGRVQCLVCGAVVVRARHSKDEIVQCACGWRTRWAAYFASSRGKQLVGGLALPAFAEFLGRWPKTRRVRDKLLMIDRLVHACHLALASPHARPAATNLIEGTSKELAGFLDGLAYGPSSTPGLDATRDEWQRLRRERSFPDAWNR